MSANFVARAAGYHGREDWRYHEVNTRQQPVDPTFVDEWLSDVSAIGFDGPSMWTAHCLYHDVTAPEMDEIRQGAADHGLRINAYAGDFGFSPGPAGTVTTDRDHWEGSYEVAGALGRDWLEGLWGAAQNRELIRELGAQYGVGFAYEPHFMDSQAEALARTAGDDDTIGIVLDTGSAAEYGYSAPEAVRTYGDRLMNVHLKDVREAGSHECVGLGTGVLDIPGTLNALRDIAYEGPVNIEHGRYDRDPMPEVRNSYRIVDNWLASDTAT